MIFVRLGNMRHYRIANVRINSVGAADIADPAQSDKLIRPLGRKDRLMLRMAVIGVIGLCCAAGAARGDVLYTWQTQSTQYQNGHTSGPQLSMSFEVSGPLSISADSHFADVAGVPPRAGTFYQFPASLVSLNVQIDNLTITKNSFGASSLQTPEILWSISLNADTAAETGSLDLSFRPQGDYAAIGTNRGATLEDNSFSTTAEVTTLRFDSDGTEEEQGATCPCYFTGELTSSDPATPTPEPSGFWILLAALGMMIGIPRPRNTNGGSQRFRLGASG